MLKYHPLLLLFGVYLTQHIFNASNRPVKCLEENINQTKALQNRAKLFNNAEPFTIISYKKEINTHTTDTDTSKCRKWKLNAGNIRSIIKNGKPIDGTTWDLSFSVLTCIVSGKVLQDKQEFKFTINAASFFTVTNTDTTVIYGDYNKLDRKYFLSHPG